MSTQDKAENTAQKAGGAAKEAAGSVTGDDSLRREGELDQAKADMKQTGEKLKDSIKEGLGD